MYDDEAPPEKVLSDMTIFEEESDEDYEIFIDDGQISDNESSESEDRDSGRNIGWDCYILRESFTRKAQIKKYFNTASSNRCYSSS